MIWFHAFIQYRRGIYSRINHILGEGPKNSTDPERSYWFCMKDKKNKTQNKVYKESLRPTALNKLSQCIYNSWIWHYWLYICIHACPSHKTVPRGTRAGHISWACVWWSLFPLSYGCVNQTPCLTPLLMPGTHGVTSDQKARGGRSYSGHLGIVSAFRMA